MKRKLLIVGGLLVGVVFGIVMWRFLCPEMGLLGAFLAACGWLLGHKKAGNGKGRTVRANDIAHDEISAAGDAAAARVSDVDRDADREVENAGDLVDMLRGRDPGPDDDG